MVVLVSNNAGGLVHYLAGRYPGKIGWLVGTNCWKEPRAWLPYAIDNGKFSAWGKDQGFGGSNVNEGQVQWTEETFFNLLDRCKLCRYKPLWVSVPDEVGDPHRTLYLWTQYERRMRQYGWPLAFVVQDGIMPRDVPESAEVIFVGGSTNWKWRNAALFCASFPRVHVGRVNWVDKLEYCERLGIESCDGTGFFRGGEDSTQSVQLQEFIAGRKRHSEQLQLV